MAKTQTTAPLNRNCSSLPVSRTQILFRLFLYPVAIHSAEFRYWNFPLFHLTAFFWAAFFRFAQDALIASDIFALKCASSGGAMTSTSFFETLRAAVSAFAALIAA